jgi:hypothetical protein
MLPPNVRVQPHASAAKRVGCNAVLGGFYHSFALSSCANNIRLLFQWAAVLCIGHGAI